MVKIFLSHSLQDHGIAHDLELRLQKSGHEITVGVGTLPTGKWRDQFAKALEGSDVLVALLSENGLASPFVASEVGAARVYDSSRGMLLLPVLFGERPEIPLFVADYGCLYLQPGEYGQLIDKINKAIEQHLFVSQRTPRIFISHRHKDEALARTLVALLEAAFHIDTLDIRCTSVSPYKLKVGDQTSDRLRSEIANGEVVLGLLSQDTADSRYVLAELGAAWGCAVPTFPLLVRGARFEDVPEPLNERHSLSLSRVAECIQLVQDLARITTLVSRDNSSARVQEQAAILAKESGESASPPTSPA